MRLPKYIYFNPFFRLCRSVSDEHHVFVVGAPRSGTTLVANVIANHSKFCSLNAETDLFGWRSCFLLFEGKAGRHSSDFHDFRRQFSDVVNLMDGLAKECKLEHGCETFLEKTPQHVFHLPFILRHFPRSKIVNVIRDPRDAYTSSRSNLHVVQTEPESFAKYWKRSIKARKAHDDSRVCDLHYENLVESPSTESTRIMGWLGHSFEPQQIEPKIMARHPLAGKASFGLLGKEISPSSVGRWRHELSLREVKAIEKIAGRYLTALGYQSS